MDEIDWLNTPKKMKMIETNGNKCEINARFA